MLACPWSRLSLIVKQFFDSGFPYCPIKHTPVPRTDKHAHYVHFSFFTASYPPFLNEVLQAHEDLQLFFLLIPLNCLHRQSQNATWPISMHGVGPEAPR